MIALTRLRIFALRACLVLIGCVLLPGLSQAQSCATPGADGPGSLTGIVNTYYAGSGSSFAGSSSIGVGAIDGRGAATPVAAGDLVLIMQVQDAAISTTNSTSYGGSSSTGQGYTFLNNAGRYEYAVAAGPASGGTIPLTAALQNSYTTANASGTQGQRRYQVVRVPQYSAATMTGTVTAPPWNGVTGGVVAFDVAGQLNWAGQGINVSGRGFRGGGGQCSNADGTGAPVNANTDYVSNIGTGTLNLGGTGNVPNGVKGEGIAGTPILIFDPTTPNNNGAGTVVNTGGTDGTSGGYPGGSFGRGAPGNAGGGGTDGNSPGNDQNSGGAGGGSYSVGGKGGFGWTPGTPPGVDGGGMGGWSMPVAPSRLFFGGGGGAGSTNNCTGAPANGAASSGAAGGGAVLIRAGSVAGSGSIAALGTNANSTVTNDASGGGGAGGNVLVFVNNGGGPIGASIDVSGGNGGSNSGGGAPHGPGGGGSGGYAAISGPATVTFAGGLNGTTATSATTFPDYGSSTSAGGFQLLSLTADQIPGAGASPICYPRLTVTKSTSTPTTSAGSTASYSITVSNQAGFGTAQSVVVTDPLPNNPNFTFASTSSIILGGGAARPTVTNPVIGATSPVWGAFTIPGGSSVTVNFVAAVAAATAPATYQNPANVTYADPTRTAPAQTVTPGGTYTAGGAVPGSNYVAASSTVEDVAVTAAVNITKAFLPSGIANGGTSVLTITLTNANPVALTNAAFTDTYPAGLVNAATPAASTTCAGGVVSATSSGTFVSLNGGTIPASGSCTVTVTVTAPVAQTFVNTIAQGALVTSQGISNAPAGTATLFALPSVTKSFSPTSVGTNADSTLSIVISNPNTAALTLANPALTDALQTNLVATGGAVTITGAGCTGFAPTTISAGATSFAITAGTLPASGTCTVSFAVRSAVAGNYNNQTSGVTTTTTPAGAPSNVASLGVGFINIAKNFSPNTIQSGGTSTLSYTLTNPTGVTQTGGNFLDTLINMSVSGNQTVGGTCTGVTPSGLTNGQTILNFTGISIPPAGCTVTLIVTSTNIGTNPNATNGVATDTLPRGPASNTDNLIVIGPATIAKAFAPTAIEPGGVSVITFTLTNPNTVGLSGIAFTDAYAANLVNATPLVVGGTCTGITTTATAGGSSFNVTNGTLPAGSSCTITVQVTSNVSASYNNTTSGVASTQSATGAASNTATLTVLQRPTITKAFLTSPISQGGTSVMRFTLSNPNASATLTNLRFTDALVGMSVSSATIAGSCVGTFNTPALSVGETNLNLTVPSLAGSANCTIDITVTSSTSGTRSNTTSGVRSDQTVTPGNPSNTANLVVLSPPVLQKNFSPGAIVSGGTASIVFTVSNPQATVLNNVQFTDPLVNMALAAGTAVVETCSGAVTPVGVANGSTSFTLTLNTLAASETCTITVSNVTSSVASPTGGHPNSTSSVTSTQTAINPGNPATGYLTVIRPPTITKSFSPNAIASGGTSVVTFTITNPNSVPLTDIRFTDNLPANLTNTAAQSFIGGGRGTCVGTIPSSKVAGNVDPINFTSTNLGPNASCTVLMDVTSSTAGFYSNTVTAITSDQTPTATTGGTDNLTVGGRLLLEKTFSVTSGVVGTPFRMRFTISNLQNAGNNQSDLDLSDVFPAGLEVGTPPNITTSGPCTGFTTTGITAGATTLTLTNLMDDLDNGETCFVEFDVVATTPGTKVNTVTAPPAGNPDDLDNATATATVEIYAAPTIAKLFSPSTIGAGGVSTVTLTLSNPAGNGSALTNASFTDTLVNMSIAGAQTVGGTCSGTTPTTLTNGATALSFSGITIPQAGSCTITFTVTSAVTGTLPNSTSGVTTTQTPTAGTGSGVVNLTVVGTALTKAFSPATVPRGALSTLTFTVTNGAGNPAQTGLAFTDTLPANVQIASPNNAGTTCGAGSVTATPGSSVISFSGGELAASVASCTVTVSVISNVAGTYNNVQANISGASAGMNTAGVNATLTVQNNPTLTKAFNPVNIAANGTSQLTITLTAGAGAQGLSGLGFTDTLPTNVVIASPSALSNSCGGTATANAGSDVISLSNGSLSAAPASCTITLNVTSANLGSYLNSTANITGLAGGLTAGGASATLNVVGTTLTKSFTPTTIGTGGVSTITFTITNGTGNPAQSGLSFTENLPGNIFVAPTPGVTNTCGGTVTAVAGAGTFNIAGGSLALSVASCTFTVNVTGASPGSYPNTSSRIIGAPTSMNTTPVNATLVVVDRPQVAKAFTPATVPTGTNSTLTITLTNPNSTVITGVGLTDLLPTAPAQMTIATPLTVSNSCGGTLDENDAIDGDNTLEVGDGSVRLTGGSIPANGTCTISVAVTAAAAGTYTNSIPIGGVTSGNAGANLVGASANLTVLARPQIAKAFAPTTIGQGQPSTLTITLTNPNASVAITGAAFTDILPTAPGQITVASPLATSNSCGGTLDENDALDGDNTLEIGDGSIRLTGGTIPAAGSCVITVSVTGSGLGAHANSIAIGGLTSTNAGSNSVAANASLTIVQPALTKTFVPAAIDAGATSTLVFTLTNGVGNPAQAGLNFTDTLPASVLIAGTPNVQSNCPAGGALVPGPGFVTAAGGGSAIVVTGAAMNNTVATCEIRVDVTSATPGTYNNTNAGNVTAVQRLDTSGVNATLTVRSLPALTKAFGTATIGIGQTTTLAFSIANNGTNAVNRTGMSFSDALPAGLVVANPPVATAGAGCAASTLTGTADASTSFGATGVSVNAGQTCVITVTVRGTTVGTKTNGAAQVTAAGMTNAVTDQVLTVVEPTLTKAFSPATIDLGGTTTLTFTLTNGSGNPAQSLLNFLDTLPAGLTVATPNGATSSNCGSPTITAVAGSSSIQVAGASMGNGVASCTISVNVTSTTTNTSCGAFPVSHTNGAGQITGLNRLGNGVTNQCLVVLPLPTLTKAFSTATVGIGQTTTLVFTVANTAAGNIARSGLSFTDTLPAGIVIANPAVPTTTCTGTPAFTASDGTQPFTVSGIGVNAASSCTVTLTVRGATLGGPYTNNAASITASSGLTNGVTPQQITVVQPTLTKAFGSGAIDDAVPTALIFTLTNGAGNPAQSGLGWTETLPANIRFTGASLPVAYGVGCSGPPTVTATGGPPLNQIIVSGVGMAASTASCTVTIGVNGTSGVTNVAGQFNASCAGNPAAFTNTSANITGETRVTDAATSQCLVVNSLPTITKAFGAANIGIGQATTLAFSIANTGTGSINRTGLTFSDALPAGLVVANPPVATTGAGCAAATLTGTADASTSFGATGVSVNAGQTCVITVTVRGNTLGAKDNNTGNVTVTGMNNGVTTQTVTVVQPSLTKAFGGAAIDDGAATALVFTLANGAGNPSQSGLGWTETLPASLRFSAASLPVAYSNGCTGPATVSATGGPPLNQIVLSGIAMPAATASCTVTVGVNATSGVSNVAGQFNASCAGSPAAFTNTATNITGETRVSDAATAQCLVVNSIPTLTKAFGAANIGIGQTTTLTFSIANTTTGNITRSGLSFSDALPAGLVVANPPVATTGAGCAAATLTGTADASTNFGATGVSVNAAQTCVITVTVRGATLGAKTNDTANVSTTGMNNGVTAQTVTVVQPSVAKTFGAAGINDGANTTLVFTLTNGTGNPAQGGIALGDTLPSGLRFNTATPTVVYSNGCTGPATAAYDSGTRVLSGLTGIAMPNATASCTVTLSGLTNEAGQTGACANAAQTNLATNVTTTNATNSSADQCLSVTRLNPNVAKTFGTANINDGATTTLVFTLTNQGTNPAQSGIALGDTLPTGLRFNSTTPAVAYSNGCTGPANGAYDNGTRVLSGLGGIAMPNGTATCTVTISGLTNAAGQTGACMVAAQTNLATNVTTTGANNISVDQCLSVTAISPNVAKTFGAASINDGAATTLVFTLTNQGTNPAQSGIALGDTLPTGLRFNSTTPAVAYSNGCTGPANGAYDNGTRVLSGLSGIAMPNGTASCTVTISGVTNVAGQVGACVVAAQTNLAVNVTTTNATNTSTDQCLAVNRINPNVAKTFGAASITDGATTTLVFTLINQGTNPAQSGIVLGDTLPTGLRFNTTTPAVVYGAGCSGPGAAAYNTGSRVLSGLTGIAMNSGTTICTVTVSGLTNQPGQTGACAVAAQTNLAVNVTTTNATNTSMDQCLTVNVISPNVAKTFGAALIDAGATTTLVFTLTNQGSNPAQSGIALGDTLPSGLRFNTTTPAVSYSNGCTGPATASYNTGSRVLSGLTGIAMPNGTATCTVTVAGITDEPGQTGVCPVAAQTNLSANVSTTNATNTSTNQCLSIRSVDLTIAKSHIGNFTVGVNGVYTLTVSNAASAPASSGTITVVDTLPTGLGFVSATGSGWACGNAGQVVTCTTAATIAGGASAPSITLTVSVAAGAQPSVINNATVSGGGEPAANTGNNFANDNTLVNLAATNSFLTDGAATTLPGTTVFYPHTFIAGQTGNVLFTTTNTTSPSNPSWSHAIYRDADCNGTLNGAEGATILSTPVAVVPGDQVCIIVRDSVPGGAPFNAQNVITVTATFNGSITYTRTDVTTVGAAGGAGLSLAKTVRNVTQGGAVGTSNQARPNDILEYVVTYSNQAASPVTTVVINDSTPAFTLFVSAACGSLPPNITACAVTTQPAVNGTGAIVWTLTGGLAAGATSVVTFTVRVNP